MRLIAIIGGTGLTGIAGMELIRRERVETPYGLPSSDLIFGRHYQQDLVFLARHGEPRRIPPHRVNYRANLWALRHVGACGVIAVAAVGGIRRDMEPGRLAVPDQIIDYTYGRPHTYFEEDLEQVVHVDFTRPYTAWIREKLLTAARVAGIDVIDGGVYGCTEGPRLETAAEIERMERDGCAMVGMTGMPEASLARELSLDYACCAVVANWAAGKSAEEISLEAIERNLSGGMNDFAALLRHLVQG